MIEVTNRSDSSPYEVKKTVEVDGMFVVCSVVISPSLLSSSRRDSKRSLLTLFKKFDSLSSKSVTYYW